MPAQSLRGVQLFCNPMDCSWLGFSVHEILQASILEWIAISSSRWSSLTRDPTHVSCISCICISGIAGRFFTTEPPGKSESFVNNHRSHRLFHLKEILSVSMSRIQKWFSIAQKLAGFQQVLFEPKFKFKSYLNYSQVTVFFFWEKDHSWNFSRKNYIYWLG